MRRSWQCFAVAVLATPWCGVAPALAQITLDGGEVPVNAAPPPTSTVNFPASVVRANNGVFGLSRAGDGSLAVLVNAGGGTGQAHVIIDVNGYFQ